MCLSLKICNSPFCFRVFTAIWRRFLYGNLQMSQNVPVTLLVNAWLLWILLNHRCNTYLCHEFIPVIWYPITQLCLLNCLTMVSWNIIDTRVNYLEMRRAVALEKVDRLTADQTNSAIPETIQLRPHQIWDRWPLYRWMI